MVPVRCGCPACKALWRLRCSYCLFGPSPRALLCSLRRVKAGAAESDREVVFVWRKLTAFINEMYGAMLCLYFVQMLPCIWRKFLRLHRQCLAHGGGTPNTSAWLLPSKWRISRDRVYQLETKHLKNALDWLRHCRLLPSFLRLFVPSRRRILEKYSWGRQMPEEELKAHILELLAS